MGEDQEMARVAAIVGDRWVKTTEEDLQWAQEDAAGLFRLKMTGVTAHRPLAVVFPGSSEEVAAVVRWASTARIPLVIRGSGTGVMGGAVPVVRAVVVDLSRLNTIRPEPDDFLVFAGAGAILDDVNRVLASQGRMIAHDPWSVALASVGGAISTDGVGYLAGRWGSMGAQVEGLEGVTADGTMVRTRLYKPVAGPDWRAIVTGTEGTLAIITGAWLKTIPVPEAQEFQAFRFRTFDQAYQALLTLWSFGYAYDLLDLTDNRPDELDLAAGFEDERGRTALVVLGAFGLDEEVSFRIGLANRILSRDGQPLGPGPARNYWAKRHRIAEAYRDEIQAPRNRAARAKWGQEPLDYLNLAMRPSRIPLFRRRALESIDRVPGVLPGEIGIWCRPEIVSLVIRGQDNPPGIYQVMENLYQTALDLDGNVECIHGPGLKLRQWLARDWGSLGPSLQAIKGALDPLDILNPGHGAQT